MAMSEPQIPTPGNSPTPPPPPPIDYERLHGLMVDRDVEQLRILSICWYVISGLAALMGCVPIFHVSMGFMLLLNPSMLNPPGGGGGGPAPPAQFIGWFFVVIGSAFMLFGWTSAILGFLTARSLPQRRRLVLCYVAAALVCLQIPFGTTLGVFTFILLSRPSIRASFRQGS
jgi:hypothetical protein